MNITTEDFDYIRKVFKDVVGITLDDDKLYLVENRLLPLAKTENIATVAELIRTLRRHPRSPFDPLHTRMFEYLVTSETSFFRDQHPFIALKQKIIPDLIKKRESIKRLKVWSAACACGQEPYSFAILLLEHFPLLKNWQIDLIGSDISTQVISYAQQGLFKRCEVDRGLSTELLNKYFSHKNSRWKIRSDIRDMVTFQQLNLVKPWPYLPLMDIVLLRNVLMYFDDMTKENILKNIHGIMEPDGYLITGATENPSFMEKYFIKERIGKTVVYRLAS
jgi:chemotaxis protein methyltransferase CheR